MINLTSRGNLMNNGPVAPWTWRSGYGIVGPATWPMLLGVAP